MKYKKSELTNIAKSCALGANQMLTGVCISQELYRNEIKMELLNYNSDDLLLMEISKRFAKYAKDAVAFDVNNGEVQDFQKLIFKIVNCCDENNWFDD